MSNDNSQVAEKLALAKILLRNFGAIHSFHIHNLERFPIASCNIAIGGQAELDADEKSVTFTVLTKRHFYLKNGKLHKRKKLSLLGIFEVSNYKYKKETAQATINLKSWAKELLWGDITEVRVIFDIEPQIETNDE